MKKSIYIFSIAMILSLQFSCKKEYLETKPTGSVSELSVFTNTADARKVINGMHRFLYRQMYGRQSEGGISGNLLYMDALGEDMVMTGQSNGWLISEYKWLSHRLVTSAMIRYNYLYFYSFISNANMVLKFIDNATGPEIERNEIKGQALAYRAWAYFMMVQLFGERFDKDAPNDGLGMSIVLEPTTEATPRSTVAETYTQINQDLDEAISLLGNSNNRPSKSNINVAVAKGFKARVALTQQNWALAAQMASVARQGFSLMSNAAYLQGFNDIDNPEWIWGYSQQEDQTTFFYSFFAYVSANYNSTNIRTNPKAINSLLYSKITETDVRKQLWDSTAKNTDFPIPPSGSRRAYMNRKFRVPNTSLSIGDVPLMRAAEMYLIEAEALARAGQDGPARDILFTLASNRDPDYILSSNSGPALINEILIQRRVELWGEGFRFYDLKRTNSPLDRRGANHNVGLASLLEVPAGDIRWQFLIPQDEINFSQGIVTQNPL